MVINPPFVMREKDIRWISVRKYPCTGHFLRERISQPKVSICVCPRPVCASPYAMYCDDVDGALFLWRDYIEFSLRELVDEAEAEV